MSLFDDTMKHLNSPDAPEPVSFADQAAQLVSVWRTEFHVDEAAMYRQLEWRIKQALTDAVQREREACKDAFRRIFRADKTSYSYHGKNRENRFGHVPKSGTRFKTPAEIAQDMIGQEVFETDATALRRGGREG